MSSKVGLVKPKDHIVCVQRMGESYVIKIVSVNDDGDGVEIIRPKSLENLMRVSMLLKNTSAEIAQVREVDNLMHIGSGITCCVTPVAASLILHASKAQETWIHHRLLGLHNKSLQQI